MINKNSPRSGVGSWESGVRNQHIGQQITINNHLQNTKTKGKHIMNIMIKQIELIERVDQLIRLQATGSPDDLAYRLAISKTKLYRIINTMKSLNAPIEYDITIQSFVYVEAVGFTFGFFPKHQKYRKLDPFVS